jgi:uncharacterized protein (TIGR03437 family)
LKPILRKGALLTAALCFVLPAAFGNQAASYTGTLATDDDQRVFYFTLAAPGPISIRTFSYAGGTNQAGTVVPAGGFDPTLAVFDANNNLVSLNRDGGCGAVAADPVTSFCWDSALSLTLPTGTYSVVLTQSENLPNGPTLSDSFVYHGQTTFTTPPGVGSQGFWDAFPSQRTASYAVDIVGAASVVTTITSSSQAPVGLVGSPYGPFTFTATSGAGATLTWSVASGSALPAGLTLNATTGVLSGTPTGTGNFNFVIQVSDGTQPVTQNVTLSVFGPVSIQTSSLPSATSGTAYGPVNLAAGGGSGSYSWAVSGLPANMASSGGVISGTPLSGGSFSVSISVTDTSTGSSASVSLTLVVTVPPLSITSSGNLGGFVPGATISGIFTAKGGVSPYTWTTTGLPAGISANGSTGAFSGTVGNPGVYSFGVQVTDAENPAATATGTVSYSVLGITTSSLPAGTLLTAYSASFAAVGGSSPYTFSSSLPQGLGLSLSSSGVLTGTPQATGNFTLVIQLTDSTGLKTSSTFVLTVSGAKTPLTVPGGDLTSGRVLVPYSAGLQASGGISPYSWSVLAGVLPSGVSLDGSGTLAGTPTVAGHYSFTAKATDASGATAQGVYNLVVNPAVLTITLGSFPGGIVGSDYPLQIFTAAGGVPGYTFAITSGSLPPGLGLAGPQISGVPTGQGTFSFTATVTDIAGTTASLNGSIVIAPAHADLILSQTSVPFSLTAGASGVPSPASVTVRSSVVLQLLNYSYTVSPAASWLDVSGGTTTPGAIVLAIDPSAPSLAASTTPYTTAITVTCVAPSPCAGNAQTINVSLTVSAPPPQLTLTSSILSFNSVASNPGLSSQPLGLQNSGGGTITINSVAAADGWVSVSGVPAALTAGPGTQMSVTVNPGGLTPGYYRSTLAIASSAGSATVPITLLITQSTTMSLAPEGGQFQSPAGNSPGKTGGSFSVSVTGAGSVAWSASLLGAPSWLNLGSSTGTSSSALAGAVGYSLNSQAIGNLPAGTYYATIQVTSADVADSPQGYQVVLNVTPASTAVKPEPSSAGLVFVSSSAGTTPAQSVSVYSSSGAPVSYQASATTTDGGNWLSVTPSTGTASSSAPGSSTISVNPTGFAAGIYTGGVSYAFSSDAVRTVNVTMLILKAGTVPSGSIRGSSLTSEAAGPCTPAKLVATQTGLFNNFAQLAGWPTPLSVKLINDCGAAVADAQLIATFSNGDPPLPLTALDSSSGVYFATWTPQGVSSQVTVVATATESPFPAATASVTGEVRSNTAPILTRNGIVDPFNSLVGAAVAPGDVIAIYGSNLAAQATPASATPLPLSLGGTSVSIGGIAAPLYYAAPGQINAQVPYELTAGKQYQVQVNAGGALSTPGSIAVTAAAPGLVADPSGTIIAQHADYSLITEAAPARPGEIILLYLAGMGATDNPVATGAAAVADPLSRTLISPVITLNGSSVTPAFAGLTPTAVGLYQINLLVPLGTPNGDLQLSVSQGTAVSNVSILPVHQ